MACTLTSSRQAVSQCGATKPGLDELKHWICNRADITFTGLTANTRTFSGFSMANGKVLYPYHFDKRGFEFTDEMTIEEGTGAITHAPTLTGRFIGLNGKNAADVEVLKDTNLVSIFLAKSGNIIVAGYKAGLTLVSNTTGSAPESLGETLAIGNTDEPEKHFEYLDTDLTTSLAALVAAESPAP